MRTAPVALLSALILVAGRGQAYQAGIALNGDVLELADDLAAGKDVRKKVAVFVKKHDDYNEVSRVYKPSAKGGVGVGMKRAADGIELRIIMLSKKGLTAAALKREKADLMRMAHVNLAVAVLTPAYAPKKNANRWHGEAGEMARAARDLIGAIKSEDSAAAKKAAMRVNNHCNKCHAAFRDNP